MGKKIKGLTHNDKRVLLQSMALRCSGLFDRLQEEVFDLCVMEYFDKYYRDLRTLIYFMEDNYPKVDYSTNNIDILYKRHHMND